MLTLLDTVRVLHLEPTDVCQAACPLCARETDVNFDKEKHHYLTAGSIKQLLGESTIARLDKMFMCGNYGDPAANQQSIDIFSYFRSINPDIVLGMNTNGGLQSTRWWKDLADILNQPQDYVVFSIDGLADTNHIYRRNVNWDLVMKNAAAFIRAGGSAHWDMLVYEHNEHQVDDCERLARKMGFTWFRAKVSKRQSTVDWLLPPKYWERPVIDAGPIDCFRNNDQSLYISAQGVLHPCCWLGNGQETIAEFDQIQAEWNTNKCNPVCKKTCSTVNNQSNFTNQWQRNIQL
jgi:MoaA/NifB/PqqE/SkfB family radical SAM enzyme